MGWACRTYWKKDKYKFFFWSPVLKERDHFEKEEIMGDNIKMDVNKWSSGQEQMADSFKHDNELSVCIISGNLSSRWEIIRFSRSTILHELI